MFRALMLGMVLSVYNSPYGSVVHTEKSLVKVEVRISSPRYAEEAFLWGPLLCFSDFFNCYGPVTVVLPPPCGIVAEEEAGLESGAHTGPAEKFRRRT